MVELNLNSNDSSFINFDGLEEDTSDQEENIFLPNTNQLDLNLIEEDKPTSFINFDNMEEEINEDQLAPWIPDTHPLIGTSLPVSPDYKSVIGTDLNTSWREKHGVDMPLILSNVYKTFESKYNNRPLTEEDILDKEKGRELREIVYQYMEHRWQHDYSKVGIVAQTAKNYATGATSGGLNRNYRNMPFNKVYEMFQEHQRSFSGGNTVTTINELVYAMRADDPTRASLAAGYLLHNQMASIFNKDRKNLNSKNRQSELFDGLTDYAEAALIDPLVLASFGIGKLLSAPISAAARKVGIKKLESALSASIMNKKSKDIITKEMADKIAKRKINILLDTTSLLIPETAINVGVEYAYQNVNIRTGAQEEFNPQSMWIAALAAIAVPSLYAGSKSLADFRKSKYMRKSILRYGDYDSAFITGGQKRLETVIRDTIESPKVIGQLLENFNLRFGSLNPKAKLVKNRIDNNKKANYFLSWEDNKTRSGKIIKRRSEQYTNDETLNLFFDFLWKGSVPEADGSQAVKGYYSILKEAGWTVHASQLDSKGGATNAFALALEMIPPKVQREMIKEFEKTTGLSFPTTITKSGKVQSSTSLSAHFVSQASQAGKALGLRGYLSKIEKMGFLTDADKVRALANTGKLNPEKMNAAIGIYKRLLTSHPATTGANIKGFGYTTYYNAMGDAMLGVFDVANAAAVISKGIQRGNLSDIDLGLKYYQEGIGSLTGTLNKGFDILTPELPIEFAKMIFQISPKSQQQLMSTIGGTQNPRSAFETFNLELLGSGKAAWKGADQITSGIQAFNLIKAQDEITKLWTFGTEVNKMIRIKYGTDPSTFFEQADVFQIISKPDFQDNVIMPAIQRTRDATASNNWEMRSKETKNMLAQMAGFFEEKTKGLIGIPIPFASFMNTALKISGDLTGVNFVRRKVHRGFAKDGPIGSKINLTRYKAHELINPADASDKELFARATAFYGLQAIRIWGLPGSNAQEEIDNPIYRIKNGLNWNMKQNEDGSITDMTYDFPESIVRITDQIAAHWAIAGREEADVNFGSKENLIKFINNIKNETSVSGNQEKFIEGAPARLWIDLGEQLGTSNVRAIKNITSEAGFIIDVINGKADLNTVLHTLPKRLLGGPVSQLAAGGTRFLDPLNQVSGLILGNNTVPDLNQGNRNLNYSFKYVDNIFKLFDSGTSKLGVTKKTANLLPQELREPYEKVSVYEEKTKDLGVLIFGSRTVKEPTLYQQLLNSAGVRPYSPNILTAASPDDIKFRGPGQLTRGLNTLIRQALILETKNFFEGEAKGISYQDLSQKNKLRAIEIINSRAKKKVMSDLKTSTKRGDKNYLIVNSIIGSDNKSFFKATKEMFPDDNISTTDKSKALEQILTLYPLLDKDTKDKDKDKALKKLEELKLKIQRIQKYDTQLESINN